MNDESGAVDNKEIVVEKNAGKEKSASLAACKTKKKGRSRGSQETTTVPKKRNSGDRRVVVVVVVNIKRDVAAAVSQRNVLVSAEERHRWSHGCHDACHIVIVC